MAISKRVNVFVLGLICLNAWTHADIDMNVCNPDLIKPVGDKRMPSFAKVFDAGTMISRIWEKQSEGQWFGTDGLKAYVRSTLPTGQTTQIADYLRNQLITMVRNPPTSDTVESCFVADLKTVAAEGNWMFGDNATVVPHPEDVGWVLHFKDFNEQHTSSDKTINGVPCFEWQACTEVNMGGDKTATVGVKFYWSDPDKWTPVAGTHGLNATSYSVPVSVQLKRKIGDGDIQEVQQNFFHYSLLGPRSSAFDIPENVYCMNMQGNGVSLPKIPAAYSYESEIIIPQPILENLVLYQKHYFDHKLNLTRLEFNPVLDGKATTQPAIGDKTTQLGEMTLIHDLSLGVSYLIDKNSSVCAVQLIVDEKGIEPETISNAKVRMTNFMDYLKEMKFSYYQEKKERGILSNLFVGLHSEEVISFYFSGPFQEIEGEDMWTTNKPIRVSVVPRADVTTNTNSANINIFNFDVDEPSILDYDISSCDAYEKPHQLQFTLSGRYDAVERPNAQKFKYQILASLLDTMNVSPLRIHNIQYWDIEDGTVVQFTLLGRPKVKEVTWRNHPDIPSRRAIPSLKKAISENKFAVGNPAPIAPVPFLFAVTDSFRMDESPSPAVPASTGWEGGQVAGMAIGMLILGLIVGAGVLFLVARKNPLTEPAGFQHKQFTNATDVTEVRS